MWCLHYSLSLPVPPAAPPCQVKMVPDNVISTSFHLTWCPPPVETTNGPITAYILEYGESHSSAPPCSISLSGGVEEHTVTGLKPHTEYYVKVATVNAAGRGPFCEPVLVQTAPDSETYTSVPFYTCIYNIIFPVARWYCQCARAHTLVCISSL